METSHVINYVLKSSIVVRKIKSSDLLCRTDILNTSRGKLAMVRLVFC